MFFSEDSGKRFRRPVCSDVFSGSARGTSPDGFPVSTLHELHALKLKTRPASMTTKHFLSIPLPFCPCFYDFSLFHFTARFNSPPDTILYKTCPILPFSIRRKRNETRACRERVAPFGKQPAPSSLSKRRKQSDTPVFSIHLNSGKDFIRQRRMHERRTKLFSPEKNEKRKKREKGEGSAGRLPV